MLRIKTFKRAVVRVGGVLSDRAMIFVHVLNSIIATLLLPLIVKHRSCAHYNAKLMRISVN